MLAAAGAGFAQTARPQSLPPERALLDRYCAGCHNERAKVWRLGA